MGLELLPEFNRLNLGNGFLGSSVVKVEPRRGMADEVLVHF